LHRWVLLKNSIVSSSYLQDTTVSEYPEVTSNTNEEVDEEEEPEEEIGSTVIDAFMFPDAGNFVSSRSPDSHDSEAQWLDSLLETLAEDEDDDDPSDSEIHAPPLPVDEDDDQLLSPTLSPLASSDDLHQSRFYSSSVSVPYSNFFSPFNSTTTRGYDIAPALNSSPSFSSAFEDPLPYHDLDDIEDSSVPDAIEDVSDDESDTLSTPSFGRSITSLSLESSASTSFPTERSRLRQPLSPSFTDKHSRYLSPFELDPLPFREESSRHTFYSAY